MRRWLTARSQLVTRDTTKPPGPDNETTDALWVSIAPNGHPRPGLPLHFRGLARAIHDLNTGMAAEPGWQPLPHRLKSLRRAIKLQPDGITGLNDATIFRRANTPASDPTST